MALQHPEQASLIVKKTCDLVGLEWLYNSLDILSDNFPEPIVRSVLDVSGVYSQMNFESRYRFDSQFDHKQLQSFVKSAVEIGANGDIEQAIQVLESVYQKKYENLIMQAAYEVPYDAVNLLHQLIRDVEAFGHTRAGVLKQIKQQYKLLTQAQHFIYKQVFKFALNSQKFRQVVLDVFPYNIAIH